MLPVESKRTVFERRCFRHDDSERGKKTHSSSPALKPQTQNDRKGSLKGKSLRGRSPPGRRSQKACRHDFKGNCTNPSCDSWHPPACQNYKSESECEVCKTCVFMHKEVVSHPSKNAMKSGGKGSVVFF